MRAGPFSRPLSAGVGIVAILTGGVWAGQGLNLIPGSFMTGDPTWLVIGSIVVLVVVLLVLSILAGPRDPNGPPGQS